MPYEAVHNVTMSIDGGEFKAAVGSGGYGGWFNQPLGSSFTDSFRKDRAPAPHELVRQFVGIAYACAELNASTVASQNRRLFRKTSPGQGKTKWKAKAIDDRTRQYLIKNLQAMRLEGTDEVEEITDDDHPLKQLLAMPENTVGDIGLSAYDHRYVTQVYLETVGRAYWYIGEKDAFGLPKTIQVLRSHLMREIPSTDPNRILSHYEYGGANGISFRPEEILKFWIPDPYNPHMGGYSPMLAAIEKIRIARKEDAHINALLENMGRPDAIWSPKGDSEGGSIGVAEAARMRSAFRQAFAQAGRGGVMVAENPGSIDVLGWKPQDIVELHRAQMIKVDIEGCFGVPDSKLNRNNSNRASAQTADVAYAKDTILPRCMRNDSAINNGLVRLYDPSGRLFMATDTPIPDDDVFQLEMTRTGAEAGVATLDESREALGLPPIGGKAGNYRVMLGGNFLVDEDGKIVKESLPPDQRVAKDPAGQSKQQGRQQLKRSTTSDLKAKMLAAGYAEDEVERIVA